MESHTGHDKRGRAPEPGAIDLKGRKVRRTLRGKRFSPAQSPSTGVAESYRLGGLTGTPQQRLSFFGQAGRLETLKKGLARLSPRMSRRLRKRSVEHMKQLRIMQEFNEGRSAVERSGR